MDKQDKIYVAGHNGMVGGAIVRKLKEQGFENIIGKKSNELDLRDQKEVNNFFATEKQVQCLGENSACTNSSTINFYP